MSLNDSASLGASEPSLEADGEELLTVAQAADLCGLRRRTLHQYNSLRRCGRYLGPRPVKLPGLPNVFYRRKDVEAYLASGWTGQPDDYDQGGEA